MQRQNMFRTDAAQTTVTYLIDQSVTIVPRVKRQGVTLETLKRFVESHPDLSQEGLSMAAGRSEAAPPESGPPRAIATSRSALSDLPPSAPNSPSVSPAGASPATKYSGPGGRAKALEAWSMRARMPA